MTTESFKKMLQDAINDWHDESWKAEGAMLALNQVLHRLETEDNWQKEEAQRVPEQDEQNIPPTNETDKIAIADNPNERDVRGRMKVIIVDGVGYKFKNAKEMLSFFSLDDYYGNFVHLVQNKGGRENIVEYEANALRRLLLNAKLHLDSYQASGFNGFTQTVMFEKEEEKENA